MCVNERVRGDDKYQKSLGKECATKILERRDNRDQR